MSEEAKKVEQTEQEANASELSERDLDNVAGGGGGVAAEVDAKKSTAMKAKAGGGKANPSVEGRVEPMRK